MPTYVQTSEMEEGNKWGKKKNIFMVQLVFWKLPSLSIANSPRPSPLIVEYETRESGPGISMSFAMTFMTCVPGFWFSFNDPISTKSSNCGAKRFSLTSITSTISDAENNLNEMNILHGRKVGK